jgi:hypothetical protein
MIDDLVNPLSSKKTSERQKSEISKRYESTKWHLYATLHHPG